MFMTLKMTRALIGCLLLLSVIATSGCDFPYTVNVTAKGVSSDGGTAISVPSPQATPELDSLVLFGASLASVAAYLRSARKRPNSSQAMASASGTSSSSMAIGVPKAKPGLSIGN